MYTSVAWGNSVLQNTSGQEGQHKHCNTGQSWQNLNTFKTISASEGLPSGEPLCRVFLGYFPISVL